MELVQLGVRVERDLYERVDAARGDVPRARFVVRALEAALGSESTAGAGVKKATAQKGPDREFPLDHGRSPASPRAPGLLESTEKPAKEERLEAARGLLSDLEGKPYRCPDNRCDFRSASSRAQCSVHGRTVVG